MTTTVMQATTSTKEAMANDAPRTFDAAAWSGNVTAHQGDLVIVRLDVMPSSAKPRLNRQLADGNTQGSRHVLDGGDCYDCDPGEVAAAIRLQYGAAIGKHFIGPVFRGPATLTHPEHGHHVYKTDCINAVIYQRNLDAELREQRVRD